MINITEEILIIANKLADEGKKPSVALIKTQLTQAVPLPTIINILKNWQHQPNYVASTITETTQNDTNNAIIISKVELKQIIEQAIAPLAQELNDIKLLLKKTKN